MGGRLVHVALPVADQLTLRFAQELGVVQQGCVAGGGGFVFLQEAAHQLVQGRAVVQVAPLRRGLGLEGSLRAA